eukprot:m.210845 g.210845  ORF g.210845 m.210845 type:complete len:365 (+) comp15827_c0_seq4:267-1361(+)
MSWGQQFHIPLAVGSMQWGDTRVDSAVNKGGILSDRRIDTLLTLCSQKGIQLIDTAEGYGGGSSERRICESLVRITKGDKSAIDALQFVVGTKFLPTIWRWRSNALLHAGECSSARLGMKPIPILWIHSPVHPLPLEVWVSAACDAIDKGIATNIGVSNFDGDQVRRAHAVASARGHKIVANQIMFNLLTYGSESIKECERVCKELDICIVGFGPVGQGLLCDGLSAENIHNIRLARITGLAWEDLQPLYATIKGLAESHKVKMAQICIAWTVAKGHIPLVGCKKVNHIEEAFFAVKEIKLSDAEVQKLDKAALSRSTLQKPIWRRAIFVCIISVVISCYYLENWLLPRKDRQKEYLQQDKQED